MSLSSLFRDEVQPLLELMGQLTHIRVCEPYSVPTLVVVGYQSCGKSSVLEALLDLRFPVGTGLKTRCPIEVHLRDTDGTAYFEIYTALDGSDMERVPDVEMIGPFIDQATARLAGRRKGICREPVYLDIYRTGAPDLTLVDLPGLARPGPGTHPDTIAAIKDVVRSYADRPDTILLCVHPATADRHKPSDALMLCRELDPEALRTIGILTHLDLLEEGEAREQMDGLSAQGGSRFQLEFVGVRNRTQEELDREVGLEERTALEEKMFAGWKGGRAISESVRGIPAVARKIIDLQINHIRVTLPRVRQTVRDLLKKLEEDMASFPRTVESDTEALTVFLNRLSAFTHRVACLAAADTGVLTVNDGVPTSHALATTTLAAGDDGGASAIAAAAAAVATEEKARAAAEDDDTTREATVRAPLHIAARCADLLERFGEGLRADTPNFLSPHYADRILHELREARGATLPNFILPSIFAKLTQEAVLNFKNPTYKLVESMRDTMSDVLKALLLPHFKAFPGLLKWCEDAIDSFYEERAQAADTACQGLLDMESQTFTLNGLYMETLNQARARIIAAQSKHAALTSSNATSLLTTTAAACTTSISATATTPSQSVTPSSHRHRTEDNSKSKKDKKKAKRSSHKGETSDKSSSSKKHRKKSTKATTTTATPNTPAPHPATALALQQLQLQPNAAAPYYTLEQFCDEAALWPAAGLRSNIRDAIIELQLSLFSYCKVVVQRFSDYASMGARLHLVSCLRESPNPNHQLVTTNQAALRAHLEQLVTGLPPGRLVQLMQPSPLEKGRRASTMAALSSLRNATALISQALMQMSQPDRH